MSDDMPQDHNTTAILKELGDIKVAVAVGNTKQIGIEGNITEIKGDIKDIKATSLARTEFNDAMKLRDEEAKGYYKKTDVLWNWRWMIIGGALTVGFLAEYISRAVFK